MGCPPDMTRCFSRVNEISSRHDREMRPPATRGVTATVYDEKRADRHAECTSTLGLWSRIPAAELSKTCLNMAGKLRLHLHCIHKRVIFPDGWLHGIFCECAVFRASTLWLSLCTLL